MIMGFLSDESQVNKIPVLLTVKIDIYVCQATALKTILFCIHSSIFNENDTVYTIMNAIWVKFLGTLDL